MRLVYFGSGEFGLPTLRALQEGGHEIVTVFTQPDRRAGRGRQVRFTPIRDYALSVGISTYQPEDLRSPEPAAILGATEAELAVVVAYGHLIPPAMLAVPPRGFVNLHASLLPQYRGAAPVPHAILAGESVTGATVFRLNERFDEGDVLGRVETPIGPEDTAGSVLARLAPLGAGLMLDVLGQIAAGWAAPVPQIEGQATRAPKFRKEDGRIDWTAAAAAIDRKVRAFQPWPRAWTCLPGPRGPVRLSILQATAVPGPEAPPGTVLAADPGRGLVLRCGDGAIRLARVQAEGKREIGDAEFLRGFRLAEGTLLA